MKRQTRVSRISPRSPFRSTPWRARAHVVRAVQHPAVPSAAQPTVHVRPDPRFRQYKGVSSHANFSQDKWDIGPAFPWDRLGL